MKSAQGNKQVVRQRPSLHFMVSVYVEQILGSLPKQQDLNYLFKKIPTHPMSDPVPVSCHWIQPEPKSNLFNKPLLFI